MLLTNWLKTFTSRLRKRTVFRSRDRRALRRHWQQVLNNQISTVEVLEDRTMLTALLASAIASDVGAAENGQTSYSFTVEYTDDLSAGAEEDHPVNKYGDEEHWIPIYESGPEATSIAGEAPPFNVSETFNLSSLAGANHTIYLDFNGHTTTGTPWNDAYGSIVTPAYDIDGDVAVFSTYEYEVMQRIWQRVAEDFAPFNVNVTTVESPASDLIKSNSSDTRWGVRVVIGENTWYSNAGGVAYVGSFNYDTDTPTFVFNTSLSGVAEAVSHEVGHTLGLTHDGTSAEEYYDGHGSGTTGWAPIMGVGYSQNLVQWSKGEYTDSSNDQDDLSIITTQNGFGYRADDHGSSIGTASIITGGMTSGIVERNTDMDYFQFTTNGGDVLIDPFSESPNLDILARLYDSGGTQIQTSNPVGALNASFTGLAAGTYYVSIEGTGEGSVSGTGYSDYGSLGQYTITFSAQIPTLDVISDMTLTENAPTQTVNLSGITAGIGESQPLRVMVSSSNTGLIRDPMVSYTSPDATGTLKFTPVVHQRGTATITVTVEDGGLDGNLDTPTDNATFSRTFDVTVNAVNGVPTIFSQGELLPDPAANPAEGDETGNAVAVDGDWMVVAADSYNDNDGIVYLYVRNDVNQTPENLSDDTWDFHSTIYAPTNGVEPGYYFFGKSVAVDGNTLIIGASYADDGDLAGSVYLYQLNEGADPGHEDDVWVHQRTFTQPPDGLFGDPYPRGFGPSVSNFGHSLAIQGQTIVVGATNADVDETAKRAGAVYVFMTDDDWNTYSTSKLTASDATDYAYLGESVSISEDENTIIAGDPYHSLGDPYGYQDGAVYLFSRDTSGTASPGDDSWSEFKMLTAVETDSQFGTSVDIENGIAVIGSNGDAYVIQESENWDVLTSLAGIGEAKPVRFGWGVAISGDVILVGGPDYNNPADPGSIYLFDGWNGWESPDLEQLYALDPNLNESLFTESIAISGGTIIAGWRNHAHDGVQTGAAYAYEYQPGVDLKADITDGSLVINNLTNQNASVSLSVSAGVLVVTHPDNRLVPPVGGNQVNLNQFTIPLSALTSGEIYINGGTGNEHVSVDTSLAAAGLNVVFTGGDVDGFDSLELTGAASSTEYIFENKHDGKIRLNGAGTDFISYTGLEPITSSIDVVDVTLFYSDVDETITVSSPGGGQISVDSTAGEVVTFQNPTGKLTLDAGAGLNALYLFSFDVGFSADLEILDSAGEEEVVLANGLNLGSGDISLHTDTVEITGAVTGTGDLEIVVDTLVFSNADSSLDAGDSNINLQAVDTIYLGEVITTGRVEITSTQGTIFDNNIGANNITASQAILSAVNDSIFDLETAVENIEVIAGGFISIINTGNLVIGGIGALEGIQSINYGVYIKSYGGITVKENISAFDLVLLSTLDSSIASLNEDLLIQSGVTIRSENSYVGLYAADDLTIEEQTKLQAPTNNINLRINYSSSDGVGGVLDLRSGELSPMESGSSRVYGSSEADTLWIVPSLSHQIEVYAYDPAAPDQIGDTLNYLLPSAETATVIPTSDSDGSVEFTGGYGNIQYTGIENLQQGDRQQLANQMLIEGTAGDDVFTINAIDQNSGTWQMNDGPETAFSAINELAFYGLTGDDRLVINNPEGAIFSPLNPILFNAGNQAGDRLELVGGSATSESHRLIDGQNAIYFNGSTEAAIRYLGVPTLVSTLDTAETILTGDSLVVSSNDGIQTRVTGANTSVVFDSFTGTLSVVGNTESASIELNSLGSGLIGALQVGGGKQETVMLNDGLDLGSGEVRFQAGTVQIAGAVTRAGDLEITATSIEFANANSSLNTGDGNLSLQADNTISLGELITTGTVEITSLNGDINDGNDSANNITASQAILSAVNGLIGYTLETEVGNLEVVSYGDIDITNIGDLIIGGVSGLEGIESTYGRVIVRSFGSIQVQENVSSFTNLLLWTQDSEIASLDEDILVHSGVTLHSDTNYVALYSDDDLTIQEQATLETLATNIYLQINYESADGVGGVLDLAGKLITEDPAYRTLIYGSTQADSYQIVPSLNSRIVVQGYLWSQTETLDDELIYYIPEGESATLVPSSDVSGTISYTGGYKNINYNNVATLQQDDLQELAGHFRVTGTAADDVLTINATNANSGTWQLNDGPVNSFSDIESFTFVGLEGDDRLVINNPVDGVFHPAGGVDFIGGTGGETLGDTLEIIGGFVAESEFEFITENRGQVFYGGLAAAAINYFNLEELVSDLSVTDQRLYYNIPDTRSLSVSDDGAGKTAFNTDYGTPLKLKTPSETLSLQYGNRPLQASQYYIILNSLGTGFGADFVINDRDDNNTVILADALHLGSADVTINTETVRIFGSVTGTGDLEIVATTIDFPNANSSLNITDGNLSLLAENTINLMEVISTGTVAITSTNGDINDNNDSANNITASRAILSAVNGAIGNTLETEVGNLEAVAYGSIEITNTGDLIIGGVGGLDGIQSTNSGYGVIVRSYGAITVEEEITSFERVVLLTLDSSIPSLSEDILIESGVTLYSETSFISLYSDDDMTIKEQAELEALGSEISSNIYLRVNYDSADGVGGVLDLLGRLSTTGSINRTLIYGSSQADSFLIAPSLDSLIYVTAYDPVTPESSGDQLIYYIPKGEVASINVTGTDAGTITFSGLLQDITYSSVETLLLAGSLILEGTASDDVLTINATDANSGTFQLNDGPAFAFTDLSDLNFNGLEGDDRLVINHPTEGLFAPVDGILFEGGDQTFADTLEILGGSATSVEHHFTNENDGSIFYNGQTTAAITYTGLEPVLDTTAATDRSFTFTGGAEIITLSDDGVVANNTSKIDSDLFGEVVTFLNATGNVTIKTTEGSGADHVHIEGVDAHFSANLTVQAGTDDAVRFQANVTDIGAGNVDIIAGSIAFASSLTTTGNVNLVATAGSITDASPTEATLITADSAVLQATLGIGGAGELDINVEVNSMTTKSPQGPITISNFGGLVVQLSELPLIILNEDAGTQSIDLSQITTEGEISYPLSVIAQSSNPALIPDPQVIYAAIDDTRSLVFTPAPDQSGMATITIVVTDGGADHQLETTGDNRTIELKFDVTINPENDAPELEPLVDLLFLKNVSEQTVNLSGISASGGESQPLQVTATSSNTTLIANPVVNYTSAEATGSLVFTPLTDQMGTTTITVTVEDGGLDGNLATTADNATITRTFDVTVRDFETISLRVVNAHTTTEANGEAAVLPAGQDWVSEWDSYWVEIWVSTEDLTSQGIATVSLDLGYQTDFTSATEIEYGSVFSQNQTGTINDLSGLIQNLSATADTTDLGVNKQLLFARIKFESLVTDQVLLDLDSQIIGPHDLAFQMQTPQLSLGSERLSTNPLLDSIGADIWANPFDLNDDDQINYRDLIQFVGLYNTRPSESGSEHAWFADFDQSDRIDYRDLISLVSNYGKSKLKESVINYPVNYPDAWNQQLQVSLAPQIRTNASPLTQSQAETALQTAIDDVILQLPDEGQQQLANVKIEVVDLKGTTLGRAAGNTIYLDIDAAGYGWFVDVTPLDHSEFQYDSNLSLIALPGSEAEGLVDLWTVIRHELEHLLGYEHQTDGLMEATLDPGERKLPDWTEETDDFFASLEDDTELLTF